jgi:hypothetical protein
VAKSYFGKKYIYISNLSFKVGNILIENGKSCQSETLILIEENETNENEMNIEKLVEKVESEYVQIENSRVEENGEQIMKTKLQKLHVQRKNWIGHKINFLCWAFCYVNDGKKG